ncbi:syntaxin domain-containing protein [Hirsutella rhossiliensis]|uniref:Syntaxin domain-containing protein n=1 Tax=Hirsutella rhossiliensis TaxID=111463 RepID=A0A9P8SEB5_9HYPO|nr:syntaxin domain-containing protein [Hirsutella rhossiliensis]KAH0957861.1 syntaxin domain-containing protein [Hirsutella rhossiliensis]
MAQYGYGGRPNPFDQRDDAPSYGAPMRQPQPPAAYGQSAPYGGGRDYNQAPPMEGGYAGGNVEMAPLAQNAGSFAAGNPNNILNECREIDRGIDDVEHNLEQLRMIQKRTLDDADGSSSSAANRQLDALSSETMALYRSLTERIRTIKSSPDSRTPKNNPQVSRVDRRLKAAIQQYQQVESQFRKRTQDQMARQYRIVRPDASEAEVRAAVEDTSGGQVFSQALMQSDRQGRARAALSAVQDRHAALVKIEQQMVELSQLFQDMDTLVVQQEAAVMQIEQKGEEVVDNLDKGNEEMGVAVNTARKTRKKKWICLGISDAVIILIIIVVVVLIYVFVIRGTNGGGNDAKPAGSRRALEGFHDLGKRMPVVQDAAENVALLARQQLHLPPAAP